MFNSNREYVLVAVVMAVAIVASVDVVVDGLVQYLSTVISSIQYE